MEIETSNDRVAEAMVKQFRDSTLSDVPTDLESWVVDFRTILKSWPPGHYPAPSLRITKAIQNTSASVNRMITKVTQEYLVADYRKYSKCIQEIIECLKREEVDENMFVECMKEFDKCVNSVSYLSREQAMAMTVASRGLQMLFTSLVGFLILSVAAGYFSPKVRLIMSNLCDNVARWILGSFNTVAADIDAYLKIIGTDAKCAAEIASRGFLYTTQECPTRESTMKVLTELQTYVLGLDPSQQMAGLIEIIGNMRKESHLYLELKRLEIEGKIVIGFGTRSCNFILKGIESLIGFLWMPVAPLTSMQVPIPSETWPGWFTRLSFRTLGAIPLVGHLFPSQLRVVKDQVTRTQSAWDTIIATFAGSGFLSLGMAGLALTYFTFVPLVYQDAGITVKTDQPGGVWGALTPYMLDIALLGHFTGALAIGLVRKGGRWIFQLGKRAVQLGREAAQHRPVSVRVSGPSLPPLLYADDPEFWQSISPSYTKQSGGKKLKKF